MCGIVGIVNSNQEPVSSEVLHKMTSQLWHRGPDADGIFLSGPVGLGHRRLSIIDLSQAANQPISTRDGRYTIVYNGEVYNFKEIRNELQSLGHSFSSQSDTEVVLHAFSEWREASFSKFNGMFALAIWDQNQKKVFLARDRYGIKPLYYHQTENRILFTSEIKAFLKHPDYQVDINHEALLEYFTFQNFFTDHTLFKNVKILPAGSYVEIDINSAKFVTPQIYWDYNFYEDETLNNYEDCMQELDYLFVQAVKRQLVSDVEVGSFLSGGMDSGSIMAIAAKNFPQLKTFTCGFDLTSATRAEQSYDERRYAREMAEFFGTKHFERKIASFDMEAIIPKLAYHLEEPRVGQSYPNYYAAELASEHVKVVLSGCGGDEIFAGYPWRYYRAVSNDNFEDYVDKYYQFWQRLIPNSAIKQVFQPVWNQVSHVWTRDIFRNVFAKHQDQLTRPEDYVNHSLYFEAKTFLHGLLVVEDKLSMAHGLELRVPFLDNDLVDFAMRIPVRFKLGNLQNVVKMNENELGQKVIQYYKKNNDGKLILRQLMEHYIPYEVTQRAKQGFSAPDASWFKNESAGIVRGKLYSSNARIYNFFDKRSITTLLDEHLNGDKNRRLFIWSLLNFEQWLETYLGL